MYINYNSIKYPCRCTPGGAMIYDELPADFPFPVEGEIVLCADDGFVMRTDSVEDYLRQTFYDGVLTLTNEPEPEPAPEPEPEPEPKPMPEPEPSVRDDTDAMLVDHEYRITLLELGV